MVTLIAMGGGDIHACTLEALYALQEADRIFGARRLLDGLPSDCTDNRIAEYDADRIFSYLKNDPTPRTAVLYSGDTGFYSGARLLIPKLQAFHIPFTVCPGISSVQLLAARLGLPWQDWNLVSAHGAEADPLAEIMTGKPVCFLTGGSQGPGAICRELYDAGLGFLEAAVGSNLTYPDESVSRGTVSDFADRSFLPLSLLYVEAAPISPVRTPGIPDSEFVRGDVPLSKQPVRAMALAQLAAEPGDILWDVGAGTGGISVELALAARRGRVYAVERDTAALELISKNREKFCAWNLIPVEGKAPQALEDLPAPDRVFVGGSGGALREILHLVLRKNEHAQICVDAVTLETLTEAWNTMTDLELQPEMTQISASQTKPLGHYHLLAANHPTFLLIGRRP